MTGDASYFDRWYAAMPAEPAVDELHQRHLGLPPELLINSSVPWDGLAEVVDLLALPAGDLLLDLACGRGGPGMEVARRTGARLVGVDASAVAVGVARQRTTLFGLGDRARFLVGGLEATGLADGCAAGVLCVDSVQFAGSVPDALREVLRVLAPGGRAVLTCWQARVPGDPEVPPRLARLDLDRDLRAVGFEGVQVADRPAWEQAEARMWAEARTFDPTAGPALASLHAEAERAAVLGPRLRRVLASATAPG